jgi:hypothetical protein
MNSTVWELPEAAQQPETPIVEARPPQQDTDASDRLRPMHPGAELGWSNHGGMVEQQSSANEWVQASSEARAESERAAMQEMTDSRQAQYSRWTGEPLGEAAEVVQSQSSGISQSQ